MPVFLLGHLRKKLSRCGEIRSQSLSKVAIDVAVLFLSGDRKGERHIAGGREDVRQLLYQLLYMSVLRAATQGQGVLRAFYLRLTGRGKPAKVALTACMRKMIVRLNAMLAANQTWKEEPA